MLVYRYNPETNVFINSEPALLDPLETEKVGTNIYLLPANCTFTEPPKTDEGEQAVWNGSEWMIEKIPKEQQESEIPAESDEPIIMDTELIDQETIEMAETVIDLYSQIEALESRITVLEGGVENGENAL
ncbi:MAG: hypothetical protein ACI3ZR_03395 [bacterium]